MRMRKCPKCGQYTLKEICLRCGVKTILPIPPKFSPEDRYVEYRIKYKKHKKYNGSK